MSASAPGVSGRAFLRGLLISTAGLATLTQLNTPSTALAQVATGQVREGRPTVPSGVVGADATATSAMVWSQTDRPSRMWVDWSTTSDMAEALRV